MGRRLRFSGESRHKVDAKGRVSIPSSFRRVLEAGDPDWSDGKTPGFYIVYGDASKPYLQCYTVEEMENIFDRISERPRGSAKRKLLERIYSTGSQLTSVDENGRIVLSAKLRDRVGISSEAYFASNVDMFQIWQPERYEQDALSEAVEVLDDLPEGYDIAQLLDEDL